MADLAELRMQQHIAHEIYRQQILQRIPGKENIIRENNIYPSVLSKSLTKSINIFGETFIRHGYWKVSGRNRNAKSTN